MMCGCGSTREREPLTVLSLFHLPRAPCCIPVRCAYFGNSCGAPFFLFYCIQFVCCSCTFLWNCSSLPPSLSLPLWLSSLYIYLHISYTLSLLLLCIYFLSLPRARPLLQLWIVMKCKKKSERKWGSIGIMVFTTWPAVGLVSGPLRRRQHHSPSFNALCKCQVTQIIATTSAASPIRVLPIHLVAFNPLFLWDSLEKTLITADYCCFRIVGIFFLRQTQTEHLPASIYNT